MFPNFRRFISQTQYLKKNSKKRLDFVCALKKVFKRTERRVDKMILSLAYISHHKKKKKKKKKMDTK